MLWRIRVPVITLFIVGCVLLPHGHSPSTGVTYALHPLVGLPWKNFTESVSSTWHEFSSGQTLGSQSLWGLPVKQLVDSLPLYFITFFLTMVIGITKGLYDGLSSGERTVFGTFSNAVQSLFEGLPDFFVISMLVLVTIFLWEHGFPNITLVDSPGFITGTIVPGCIAAIFPTLYVARVVRISVEEQYEQPYLVTARSKGLPPFQIMLRHLFPNTLPAFSSALSPALGMMASSFVMIDYLLARENGFVGGLLKAMGDYGGLMSQPMGLEAIDGQPPFDPGLVLVYFALGFVVFMLLWIGARTVLRIFGYRAVRSPYSSILRESFTGRGTAHVLSGVTMLGLILILSIITPGLKLSDPHKHEYSEMIGFVRTPAFPLGTPHHPLGSDAWGGDLLSQTLHGILPTFFYVGVCALTIILVSVILSVVSTVWNIRALRTIVKLWHATFTVIPGVIACLLIMDIPSVYWFGAYSGITPQYPFAPLTGALRLGLMHTFMFVVVICMVEVGRTAFYLTVYLDDLWGKSYMEAAITVGNSPWGQFCRYCLRSFSRAVLDQFTLVTGRVLILTATLGFFDYAPELMWQNMGGIQTVQFTSLDWSSQIAQNGHDWFRYPWVTLGPAFMIAMTVLALNLVRLGLQKRWNSSAPSRSMRKRIGLVDTVSGTATDAATNTQ